MGVRDYTNALLIDCKAFSPVVLSLIKSLTATCLFWQPLQAGHNWNFSQLQRVPWVFA